MFILGHAGVGKALADRLGRPLPVVPLLFGTLLPDLIDKPLYYSGLWPFITSTRSFGHTALFLLSLAAIAWARHSRPMQALVIGMATHMFLDVGADALRFEGMRGTLVAPLWPLLGLAFWVNETTTMKDHLLKLAVAPVLLGEVIGAAFLIHAWRSRPAHRPEFQAPT